MQGLITGASVRAGPKAKPKPVKATVVLDMDMDEFDADPAKRAQLEAASSGCLPPIMHDAAVMLTIHHV